MIEIIYFLVLTNIALLVAVIILWRKSKALKARPDSIELQEFLMDLLSGGGLIHVKRIAPTDIVIRRSRNG